MSTARFIQQGSTIDFTPAVEMAAGTVVVRSSLLGVLCSDLKPGQRGSLALEGIFEFPKVSGPDTSLPIGSLAYWDDANDQATPNASGTTLIGKTVFGASDTARSVRVRLSQ